MKKMKNKIYYNLTDLRFRRNGAMVEVFDDDNFAITTFVYQEDFMSWLEGEMKPMFTDAEKAILKSIDAKYEWIARTDDVLWVGSDEPEFKSESDILVSHGLENEYLVPLSNLFRFIENNTYYSIKELLDEH